MKAPTFYKAKIYYDDTITTVQGMLFAESFADAAQFLEKTYETELLSLSISLLESNDVFEMPADIFQNLADLNEVTLP